MAASPRPHPTAAPLTRLGHFGDGHTLLPCHEAQDGEDGKAGHEAGAAVEEAEGHAVPGRKGHSISQVGVQV